MGRKKLRSDAQLTGPKVRLEHSYRTVLEHSKSYIDGEGCGIGGKSGVGVGYGLPGSPGRVGGSYSGLGDRPGGISSGVGGGSSVSSPGKSGYSVA